MAIGFRRSSTYCAHDFLPRVDGTTSLRDRAGHLTEEEKAGLMRRTLSVAMTRARGASWTGQVRG